MGGPEAPQGADQCPLLPFCPELGRLADLPGAGLQLPGLGSPVAPPMVKV